MVYKTLLEHGITPRYEKESIEILPTTTPVEPVKFYVPYRKKLKLVESVRGISYTPDFTFYYKDTLVIIEAKGFANDTFPLKKKLIFRELNKLGYMLVSTPILFFEVHNKTQLLEAINIIKNYESIYRPNQEND